MRYFTRTMGLGMFLVLLFSCKKLEYDQGITTFGEVFFIVDNVESYPHLKIKYNGNDIDQQQGTGRIRVPEGEAKFEFYDERSGKVLAEKSVNIEAGLAATFIGFQPSEDASIAFLDPDAQNNEETPPEGFMKIKIANYSAGLLPDKVDVVFHGLVGRLYVPTDTISNVGNNLEIKQYYTVNKGNVSPSRPNYQLSFIDSETKEEIKNLGGTIFFTTAMFANAEKGVYTVYLTAVARDFEAPAFLEGSGKYFTIQPNILFAD
ncbi:hypothetical protein ACR79B_03325 [Sphingobacterium spiritivorum]|uniref:hypothetical protein n=1 Tax=Sphingobacterium spiritivorum TaxID=258 RepID=UPI003DA56968